MKTGYLLYEQIKSLPEEYVRRRISEYLAEDAPNGDITADSIFRSDVPSTAIIQAEEPLVFAGAAILPVFFGEPFKLEIFASDGDEIDTGAVIARVEGSSRELLRRERPFLNLFQRLCGIATLTAKYVEIAKPWMVYILDTRKTTPGLRLFEKYAVGCGGGANHRLDLSSGILIKDNHIKAAGGIANAVEKVRQAAPDKVIEVETENLDEVRQALEAGAGAILLDNMTPSQVTECVYTVREYLFGDKIFVEASGGITLENLKGYVRTGVNAISVGALTHSARSSNIHIELE